jgi:hypothetical protein
MRALAACCLAALLGCLTPSPVAASASECRPTRLGGTYSMELIGSDGQILPTFDQDGQTFVMGQLGDRYTLRLRNASSRRVEFVAAVDGRDVLDGKSSELGKRGYIVDPYGQVDIDGFRLNTDSVAAFRFSSVSHSYASRMGDARDVGVIGVAVFPERPPRYVPPPVRYYRHGYDDYRSQGDIGNGMGAGGSATADMAPPPASAPAPQGMAEERGRMAKSAERPGLGTEFGEQRESHVYETEFERASSRPAVMLTVRYDDRQGLQAMGVDIERCCGGDRYDLGLRESAQPFRRDPGFSQPPPGWNN